MAQGMIARAFFTLWVACAVAKAATSDIILALHSGHLEGTPGNIVFDGARFVVGVVESNGAIQIVSINTNGAPVSTNALGSTGNTPRLALNGPDFLFAWLDTNAVPSLLKSARVSNGAVVAQSILGTNVAEETVALSGKQSPFVVVWQSEGSNSTVYTRTVNGDGAALSETFAISSGNQPQRHPAIDTDGLNHLVCWVEQNVASNDWRVLARVLSNGVPSGAVLSVSQTNSYTPHETACSFGTNYLVAWSTDEGPYSFNDFGACCWPTNTWFAHVYGRMITPQGTAPANAFPIIRAHATNSNVTAVFDGHRYLVWANWNLWWGKHPGIQILEADGSRAQFPITEYLGGFNYVDPSIGPRLAFGAGRFCAISMRTFETAYYSPYGPRNVMIFGYEYKAHTFHIQRGTNSNLAFNYQGVYVEYSTNLVDWAPGYYNQFIGMTNHPRMFVRSRSGLWTCIANLRAMNWAKIEWVRDNRKRSYEIPLDSDLFGPGRYLPTKPVCPHNGAYTLGEAYYEPSCTVGGHFAPAP